MVAAKKVVVIKRAPSCRGCGEKPCLCWYNDAMKLIRGPLSPQLRQAIEDGARTWKADEYMVWIKTRANTIRNVDAVEVNAVVSYHANPEDLEGPPWTVTHSPTGEALVRCDSEKRAQWAAHKLASVLVPEKDFVGLKGKEALALMKQRGMLPVYEAIQRLAARQEVEGDREVVAAWFANPPKPKDTAAIKAEAKERAQGNKLATVAAAVLPAPKAVRVVRRPGS